jgi:hypothetical protein
MGRNSHPASIQLAAEGQARPARAKRMNRGTRISITIPLEMQEWMAQESAKQGRSLSNLASFWVKQKAESLALEQGINLGEP